MKIPRPRTRTAVVTALVLAAVTLTVPAAASTTAGPDAPRAPRVKTAQGLVEGVSAAGADRFLGLPFAAPPVKDLRFKPPATPASWSGIRAADRQGPACLQFAPGGIREEQAVSEDCLYLDVYRPAGTRPGARLPVMVWMHGGGYTQGTGVIYGGQTAAAATKSIVISINYRLGALGNLALPQLDIEQPKTLSGNYGTLDQIESLRWVARNIGAFGGDAGNVTVYGQSAGGWSVCTMLASPLARDLLDRAVVQSASCDSGTPKQAALTSGQDFATAVGCTDKATAVACLRKTWAPNLIAAAQKSAPRGNVAGTPVLPLGPGDAIARGRWNKVPVMIGNTKSEGKLFVYDQGKITAAQYEKRMADTYGKNATAVLKRYPVSAYPTPFAALAQVTTDAGFACGTDASARLLAKHTATYRYEFDDPTGPSLYGFQLPGTDLANAHSAELDYLFDFTLGARPLTARQEALSLEMMHYWAAFAKTGSPQVKGQPQWPAFRTGSSRTLVLGPPRSHVVNDIAEQHNCAFWAGLSS